MKINICLLLILVMFSCKKEKDTVPEKPFEAKSGGVYISHEGNFGSSNATISYYNPDDGTVFQDVFTNANNTALGDICQSMTIINNRLYLVINNSGKIEVCDPYTMKRTATISGLTSPRYITYAGNSKAYVSDTYSNNISIINLNNNSVSGTINLNGWTEQMLLNNNSVFITNVQSDYLYVADVTTDVITDSIFISKGGSYIAEDKNGKLWVLCGGDYLHTYEAALYKIDPVLFTVESRFDFTAADAPSRLAFNKTSDTLFFLNNGVFRMSINDGGLPSSPFIQSSGNVFYGLAVDKNKNEIYVSDAIDFVQKGKIYRYDMNGVEKNKFTAGIIPGDFLFLQ